MTTVFFLLRHAAHDDVGSYLAGRSPNIRLGPAGCAQALRLGERMRTEAFDAIFASPRDRTQETASAVSIACGVGPVGLRDDLDEVDFGCWSGRPFAELDADPDWRRWNEERSVAATPAGERMEDVRRRICGCMKELSQKFRGRAVVLVSHADVIKSAICHTLGLTADSYASFDVDPASINVVVTGDWGAKVRRLNETV